MRRRRRGCGARIHSLIRIHIFTCMVSVSPGPLSSANASRLERKRPLNEIFLRLFEHIRIRPMETDITEAALSGKKRISAALFASSFHYLLGPRIRRPAIRRNVRRITNRIIIRDNTRIVLALSSEIFPHLMRTGSAALAVRRMHLHLRPRPAQDAPNAFECRNRSRIETIFNQLRRKKSL